ncbi:APC family permease [Tepidibacillus marianensis]|uniref:APC family permease n=1 Tax=Tepidibacillus marianensis TaxID=3131995 RepID=UPI0030D1CB30
MSSKQKDDQFLRVLTSKDVLVLSIGAMIGWGWVVLTGNMIKTAGSIGSMLAFAVGGLMVILVGLTYAELTSAMPKVGGEHVFVFRGLGATASFIATWFIILGYISIVAFETVALPTVLEYLLPNYKQGYLWTIAGYDTYLTWVLVGSIGSIFITAVNYLGIKFTAFLQLVLTSLIGIVGLLFIGGGLFNGSTGNMEPLFSGGIEGFTSVLIMIPFFFVGFDVIPQASEEINLPYKMIGKVLLFSVILTVVWYILVILGVARALTPEKMDSSSLVTADAMVAIFHGSWAGKLLVVAGIGGIITSWNAFYVGGSRAIYAMAKAKMLPEFLGYLHPKYKTPSNAIILIGIFSALAPLLGRQMLVWLVDASGLSIVFAYLLVTISFVVLRKKSRKWKGLLKFQQVVW